MATLFSDSAVYSVKNAQRLRIRSGARKIPCVSGLKAKEARDPDVLMILLNALNEALKNAKRAVFVSWYKNVDF